VKPGESGLDRTTAVSSVEITIGEPPARTLYVAWSRALEAALQSKPQSQDMTESNPAEGKNLALPPKSRTFDLLMEVELPVSVSFGRAQLPLRDVLKLNSGSIVELNRTISDLVEVIVNNCVIARGEVVVVEGNYGVRIHQVVSREERLRTLK
jgi:flagellar motor switch protein FliN/FliY